MTSGAIMTNTHALNASITTRYSKGMYKNYANNTYKQQNQNIN